MKRISICFFIVLTLLLAACAKTLPPEESLPGDDTATAAPSAGESEITQQDEGAAQTLTIASNRAENGYEKALLDLRSPDESSGSGGLSVDTALLSPAGEVSEETAFVLLRYFARWENGDLVFSDEERAARLEDAKLLVENLLGAQTLSDLTEETGADLFSAQTEDAVIESGIGATLIKPKATDALPLLTEEEALLSACTQHALLQKTMELCGISDPEILICEHEDGTDGAVERLTYRIYQRTEEVEKEAVSRHFAPIEVRYNRSAQSPYTLCIYSENRFLTWEADVNLAREDAIENVLHGNSLCVNATAALVRDREQIRSVSVTYQLERGGGENAGYLYYVPYYVLEAEVEGETQVYLVPTANFDLDALSGQTAYSAE